MKKIIIRNVPETTSLLHQHPLLQRIYAARGVNQLSEIDYDLKHLLPYHRLTGIDQAVDCLAGAIKAQAPVLIVGDFDADGATSSAVAVLALRALGLQHVSYLIPNRFEYGYGLTPEIVEVAAKSKPYLIVTVDNGIASIEGVRRANELGIKVVITDHHLPGNSLPEAAAIVNPNQQEDQFPSKCLAGVGVIFYLMLALRSHLRDLGWFIQQNIPEPNMAQFLDLVALGTFADTVNLDHNNRILVSQGVERVRSGKCRPGIKALFAVAKRNYEKATLEDFGFVIAPRINAAGRLDDMSLGVECLLTEDPPRARRIAQELNQLNEERREIAAEMQQQALRVVDNLQLEQNLPAGVCVFEESWHQGVLGIVAARLKDKLYRPVIAFAAVSEHEIKGSARSIGNVHIRDLLNDLATKNPGLITRFGGHAMAAGLSLARDNYENFSQAFAQETEKYLKLEDLQGVVYTDGELAGEYFDLVTAELLAAGGPWGAGFNEPIFSGDFIMVQQRLVGQKHLKLVLRHQESKQELDAICFNVNIDAWPNLRCSRLKIVYCLGINEYNYQRSLQLLVKEIISYE